MIDTVRYRREIDGLRAIAVLPVILFHAGITIFSGGYIGVDVFYVLSGYLITGILLAELEAEKFSLLRFYERRARRILPALFVVILVCLPLAWHWMLPNQFKDFAATVISVIFFSSNIYFMFQQGYFAPNAELNPLLHTWSLAVEEQYYLLFPPLLFLFWKFGRQRAFALITGLAVLSFMLSEWGWRNHPTANFYLAPTRAWELLAGSACAFWMAHKAPKANDAMAACGLAMIIFSIFYFDKNTPFPSSFTLVPVLGTAVVVLFGKDENWTARLLSWGPFVGIGLISYSAYLWHQPLFAFARIVSLREPSTGLMAFLAALSFALAYLTWRLVETPFRQRPIPLLPSRKALFGASGAATLAIGVVGLLIFLQNGFPARGDGTINLAQLEERFGDTRGLSQACEFTFNNSSQCYTSLQPNFLLWGDSFAMHLEPGLVADRPDIRLQQHTISSCAPILGIAQMGGLASQVWARRCISFNDSVFAWLQDNPTVKTVILSSPFSDVLEKNLVTRDGAVVRQDAFTFVAQRLSDTVDKIRSTGAHVVIVGPTPRSGWDTGHCLLRTLIENLSEERCNFQRNTTNRSTELLDSLSGQVPIYALADIICGGEMCQATADGIPIFRDTAHLSKEGSAHLGKKYHWASVFEAMAR